jgi:hypothetical protein
MIGVLEPRDILEILDRTGHVALTGKPYRMLAVGNETYLVPGGLDQMLLSEFELIMDLGHTMVGYGFRAR